jgi:CheY-like chemotaxis protein/HPt (histidine-containing phosphotransfer) domain-containing protein
MNLLSFKIDEQSIDFSIKKDANVPIFFIGDPNRIHQVLLNLVNNAVKFTKDGEVTLSIRLIAKLKNNYVLEFSVKDTGIGMTEEQRNNLFVPFSQADSSISRKYGGTGLGLPIVKNLVELMGGSITVFSVQDEGSTFNVQLTLEGDRNKDYEERQKLASTYFQNIRILVLEKNAFYTNLLKDYLQAFNMVGDFVTSEARAVELMQEVASGGQKPYNLLIVDYLTPTDNGIEFCNRLKAMPWLEVVPKFILMIPFSREEIFDQLEAAHLDFGITKPIIPSILYNSIIETLKIDVLKNLDSIEASKSDYLIQVAYPYHILIVDDNKTNQFIAQSILEQSGFVVNLADNGQDGWEFFKKNQSTLDLILMDLHMPGMSGYDATALIRNVNKTIPIIAMTADAVSGVEESCKKAGLNGFISKPFEPELFVSKIVELLRSETKKDTNPLSNTTENVSVPNFDKNVTVLDEADGLKHLGGNKNLYILVLKEYYSENKAVDEQLTQLIETHQYDAAIQVVHKIKSSSGSIGAKPFYSIASNLQKALVSEDQDLIAILHAEFNEIFKSIMIEIEQYNKHV